MEANGLRQGAGPPFAKIGFDVPRGAGRAIIPAMAQGHGDGTTGPDVSPRFERIDHTADVGVRVRGRTLEALFAHAAEALFDVMFEPVPEPGPADTPDRVRVEADDLPGLLQAWLSELLYRFLAEGRVGTAFAVVRLVRAPGACALEAEVRGGPYDPARHALRTELKAVTFHQLRVEETAGGGWEAQVIFDA